MPNNSCRRDTFAIGDVAEALEAAPVYPSVTRLCGVGHSFGGAALLAADIARVALFDAVCGPFVVVSGPRRLQPSLVLHGAVSSSSALFQVSTNERCPLVHHTCPAPSDAHTLADGVV